MVELKRRLHAAIALIGKRNDFIRFFNFLCCFIGPPLVAILDEPTTGVDPHARQQMQEIFLKCC